MTFVDKLLQKWRIKAALNELKGNNLKIIDVGAHDGELFRSLGNRLSQGIGIDPLVKETKESGNYTLLRGIFPDALAINNNKYNAITMLAVIEHIPANAHHIIASACNQHLQDGGLVIITVPSPLVDRILKILRLFHLIDGMSLEEHYGLNPKSLPSIFAGAGFCLTKHKKFQIGLNNLFVFQKKRNI